MRYKNQKALDNFAVHFRAQRKLAGFTQEELAYVSGITLSQIARIETARINPTYLTLLRISETLQISMADLIDVTKK